MYTVTLYVSPYFPKERFVTDDIEEALQFLREENVNHWQITRKSDGVVIAQQAHHIIKSID
jgi:hypothetical protein